jgi:hypothetical protein
VRPPKEVLSLQFLGDEEVKKPTTNKKLIFNHFKNIFAQFFFSTVVTIAGRLLLFPR